jgi:hypothetical protein
VFTADTREASLTEEAACYGGTTSRM